jgi:hypothetical protein
MSSNVKTENKARGKLPADLRNWLDSNDIEEVENKIPGGCWSALARKYIWPDG